MIKIIRYQTFAIPLTPTTQQTVENGTIQLPESIRHYLNLQPSDQLILTLEPNDSL